MDSQLGHEISALLEHAVVVSSAVELCLGLVDSCVARGFLVVLGFFEVWSLIQSLEQVVALLGMLPLN